MNKLFCLFLIILAPYVYAQESETSVKPVAQQGTIDGAEDSTAGNGENKLPANTDQKMVREANITLRTTVTGNQEQPRVMYILPWQSPLSPDLEMDMLSSQEEAVFGHVERDEMQRNLEAAGEFNSTAE